MDRYDVFIIPYGAYKINNLTSPGDMLGKFGAFIIESVILNISKEREDSSNLP
jgi:hypothetical protein